METWHGEFDFSLIRDADIASATSTRPFCVLVFGASGITGWAIAKETLSYPTDDTFDRVIALSNRPLKREDVLFPADDRLRLYSVIDLAARGEKVATSLALIDGIEGVTHVYFSGW